MKIQHVFMEKELEAIQYSLADFANDFQDAKGMASGRHWAKCQECGARLTAAVALAVEEDGTQLALGLDCAETLGLEVPTTASLKKMIFDRNYPGIRDHIEAVTKEAQEIGVYVPDFLDGLKGQLQWRGALSQKQVVIAIQILADLELAIQNYEAPKPALPVPTGKVVIEGTVISLKNHFSEYGISLKAVILSDDGWKVWGTMPAALREANKGDRVRFVATVTASDDPTFGFYKRPSVPTLVSVGAGETDPDEAGEW